MNVQNIFFVWLSEEVLLKPNMMPNNNNSENFFTTKQPDTIAVVQPDLNPLAYLKHSRECSLPFGNIVFLCMDDNSPATRVMVTLKQNKKRNKAWSAVLYGMAWRAPFSSQEEGSWFESQLGPLCGKVAWPPRVCVGSSWVLWLPPTVQRHAC